MRLWHYKLIPYLPKSQLVSQWRELNSIFKKQDNHILINYVYEYPKFDLYYYSHLVAGELINRGYRINKLDNFRNYFAEMTNEDRIKLTSNYHPFQNHHNKEYLTICYWNLKEKWMRGQKDLDNNVWAKLDQFYRKDEMGIC